MYNDIMKHNSTFHLLSENDKFYYLLTIDHKAVITHFMKFIYLAYKKRKMQLFSGEIVQKL